MNTKISSKNTGLILSGLALFTFIGHLLVSGNYGYFLDEFYTIACSNHLSFGFIDIPPVVPSILAFNTAIFGDSLAALHIIPSLLSGLIVVITGLMVKELGGGGFATLLAALSAVFAPVWMAVGTLYTYDVFDQFFIILLFYVVILLIKREKPKLWLVAGAIAGIGLMTKPSIIFFIAVLVLTMLFTKHRNQFLTPWPWLGGIIILLVIFPAALWQFQNGFPIMEYWKSYSNNKTADVSSLMFLMMQVIAMNFVILPVWGLGLWYFLFHNEGKKYRWLGLAYCCLFILLMAIKANLQMLTPAYAMLIAGGSVLIERFVLKKSHRWIKAAFPALVIIFGLIQAPSYMPILPVDTLVPYLKTVGSMTGAKSIVIGNEKTVELPLFLYNRMEWDVLVDDVTEVYNSLPEKERADTAIVTQNYGWAGAIDLLGKGSGLPNVVCGQLNYYLFSLEGLNKGTWMIIGKSYDELAPLFQEVTLAKTVETKYRLPREMTIYICRRPNFTLDEAKEGIKNFN